MIGRYLFILMLLFCSCTNKNEIQQKRIENSVYNSMKSLQKGSVFEVVSREKSLGISFTFTENYFFDKHSNRVLFSYLIYDLGNNIDRYDTLTIQYDYANLNAPKWNTVYSKKNIEALQAELENNVLLRKMLFYSLKEIDGRTTIQINKIMEILNSEFIPDEFTFEGSVFDLMRAYSMTDCKDDSTGIAEQWNLLIEGMHYPKFETKHDILDTISEIKNNYCDSLVSYK